VPTLGRRRREVLVIEGAGFDAGASYVGVGSHRIE
jgi:hypothetical protein